MKKASGIAAAAIAITAIAFAHAATVRAQSAGDYPARSIRMIVPFPPGGSNDIMGLGSLIQTIPHLKAGKIRALATTGAKRASPTPELPTIAEAGVPGYEANNWWAVAAPAGTPAGIITKLNTEIARYLKLPETLKRFEAEGVDADFRTPEAVRKMLPVEMAKWANVAKAANIRSQ